MLTDPPSDASTPPPAPGEGEASAIPALEGLDYVPGLFSEQYTAESGQFDPYLGWRLFDYDGQYMDIRNGERVSRTTTVAGDPVVVWFFGGSPGTVVVRLTRSPLRMSMYWPS